MKSEDPYFIVRTKNGETPLKIPSCLQMKYFLGGLPNWEEIEIKDNYSIWKRTDKEFYFRYNIRISELLSDHELTLISYIFGLSRYDFLVEFYAYFFPDFEKFLTHSEEIVRKIARRTLELSKQNPQLDFSIQNLNDVKEVRVRYIKEENEKS